MGVVTTHAFRTRPGHLVEHIARTDEARVLLQELGLQAFTMAPVVGSDIGTLATVVNYADNAAHASAVQRLQSDERWTTFWAAAMSEPTAELEEASLFSDVDPTYAPAADRPLGVLQLTQWQAVPGRMARFMEQVGSASGHIDRLGGTVRVLQCMSGKFPMTAAVAVTFEDLDHYGAYSDKLAVDEQWQAFWADVMSDPSAHMVRSGVYQITV